MCIRQFDSRHPFGILRVLRNQEYTSIILEMPDVTRVSLFCVLCLSSPVEWSPTTYVPYSGAY
jgi:hypothetical protein